MQWNTFSNSLYKLRLPSFCSAKSCSGLVLNLIFREDRVCPFGLLKQRVAGIPSVSPLNCWNLAPVTSNKTLRIVYSNLWPRKSGFPRFLLRRGASLLCLFFYFHYLTFLACEPLLVCEFFRTEKLSDVKNCTPYVLCDSLLEGE